MTVPLAQHFLDAAIDPAGWIPALRNLAETTRSDHAQLIGIGADYAARFNWISDVEDGMVAAFAHSGTYTPDTNFRVAARIATPAATLLSEADYDATIPGLANTGYVDLCRDWGISFGAQIDVRDDARGLLGLALLRSDTNGRTDADDRAVLAAARASISTAIDLQIAIEHQGHALVAGGFEAMSAACFVLDARMRVRAFTPKAEALLAEGLVTIVNDRPTLADADADRKLARAFIAVAAGESARHVLVTDTTATMHCRLHRLPAREWSLGFAPYAVLVIRRRATGGNDAAIPQLRDQFGLTRAEAEIALRLAAGDHRTAICASRGISRETLRSHLRALFAKMEVRRETQAIHLLHAMLD